VIQQSSQVGDVTAQGKKKRHVFRWFFLAVQVLFVLWLVSGLNAVADNCDGKTGQVLEARQAGTAIGTGIGVGLIIVLWAGVDIILGVSYLIFRKR